MRTYLLISTAFIFSFITVKAQIITDNDGNIYTSVMIGSQEWLQQNLMTKTYNNGDSIAELDFSDVHCGEPTPKYRASYGWTEYADTTYGQLYTWYAAMDPRGVCPSGYVLPTQANWDTLINYLGYSVAAGHLKESGTAHWIVASAGADNSTGFTALPGGHFLAGGFNSLTTEAHFWASTEQAPGFGHDFWFRSSYDYVTSEFSQSCFGYSVRCIKTNNAGLNENNLMPQIKIFPNPATENVIIEWEGIQPEVISLTLYTMQGVIVKTLPNESKTALNVGGLPPGEYLLSITTTTKNYLQKLVVQ